MKKLFLAVLLLAPALSFADQPRQFQVEVREFTENGQKMMASQMVVVECDRPAPVNFGKVTTYNTTPPQPGPSLEFKGEFLWAHCQDQK